MKIRKFRALGLATLALSSQLACAAGFQLFEESAVNMGNFGSGGAASIHDASAAVANPAMLTYLSNQQAVASSDVVLLDALFNGQVTWTSTNGLISGLGPSTETGISQGGRGALVPAFHYAAPITDNIVFGLNVHSPFGLETRYSDLSVLRYAGTRTRLITINASPALAIKLHKMFSVGAGFDLQYAHVIFNSIAGAPGFGGGTPFAADTRITNLGDDFSCGWHVGIMLEPMDGTRLGVAYRSIVRHRLKGESQLTGLLAAPPLGGIIFSGNLAATLKLPETWIFSAFHQFNKRFSANATVYYTRWEIFRDIVLENAAGQTAPVGVPQNFSSTVRIAVGGNVQITPNFLIRFGGGYDQTPTNDEDRFVRLPDAPRIAVSLGAHWQAAEHLGFDVGVTHFFVKDAPINNTATVGTQSAAVVGFVDNHANLLGAQMVWDIA